MFFDQYFYWSVVDLQVELISAAQQIDSATHTHTYIYIFLIFFSIMVVMGYWI